MPEGDTIWRAARSLDAALAGRRVRAFRSSLPVVEATAERLRIAGRTILRVEARGKHLLFVFGGDPADSSLASDGRLDAGPVLHTHQGMHGRWQLERVATPAPSPGSAGLVARATGGPAAGRTATSRGPAAVTIDVGDLVARCLRPSLVELLPARALRRHGGLARLGPDLLAADFDAASACARLRARGGLEIGVALLDQTALAGIGNVYKSEVLFLCGVAPRALVSGLPDATLARLVATAERLMRANLGPGPRRTTSAFSAERLYVYRRSGRPCRRCGGAIERMVQGEEARSTYFCPRCQTHEPRTTG